MRDHASVHVTRDLTQRASLTVSPGEIRKAVVALTSLTCGPDRRASDVLPNISTLAPVKPATRSAPLETKPKHSPTL